MSFLCSRKPSASPDPPAWLPELAPRVVSKWFLGVDLGQSFDPTALCLVEERVVWRVNMHRDTEHRPGPPQYLARHLERLPLGLSYVDQAARIMQLIAAEPLAGGVEVAVDRSGVGRAVTDLLRDAGLRRLTAVTITAGDGEKRDGPDWKVSKLQLISRLQARLHDGTLKIAKSLPLAAELAQELQDFRVNYSATGYMGFSARSGAHDDLVLALALAVWLAQAGGRPVMLKLRGV